MTSSDPSFQDQIDAYYKEEAEIKKYIASLPPKENPEPEPTLGQGIADLNLDQTKQQRIEQLQNAFLYTGGREDLRKSKASEKNKTSNKQQDASPPS